MKICFDCVCDEALLFSATAEKLRSEGYDICVITLEKRWRSGWEGKFISYNLHCNDEKINYKVELERISQCYDKYNIGSFILSDRFVRNLPRYEQEKILVRSFICVEKIINSGVDVFFTTGVAYLYNLVILAVCKKNNKRAFSLYSSRLEKPSFTFSDTYGDKFFIVNSVYKENMNNQHVVDVEYAMNYIKKNINYKENIPAYMKSKRHNGGVNLIFVIEFINRVYQYYFSGWKRDGDYITQSPFWYVLRDCKRIFKKMIMKLLLEFDNIDTNENYFIFPLHLQPEASTLVLGHYYENQLETIKNISKQLPLTHKLYVKVHPSSFGREKIKFFREIKNIFNVRLISPYVNNHGMISNCQGVIVISGTMGWEAYLMGKPVYVLGDVFYDGFEGVHKVKNLDQLYHLIRGCKGISSLKLRAIALQSMLEGSFEGFFDVHKLDTKKLVLSNKNIHSVHMGVRKCLNVIK